MFRIAICDDDKILCAQLEEFIITTGTSNNLSFDTEVFFTGESLQAVMNKERFDVVFLDIELVTTTGIKVAYDIRYNKGDNDTQIVYISGKDSYAMELFKTRPLDFLVKPLKYQDVENTLLTAASILKSKNLYFEFMEQRRTKRVPISSILYFESMGKKIRVVTTNETHTFYGKKSEVLQHVSSSDFLEIHNSYLINYNHVVEYTYNHIELINGDILPISQKCRKESRNNLLKRKRRIEHES